MTRHFRVQLPEGPREVDADDVTIGADGVLALVKRGQVKVSQQMAPNGQLVPVAQQQNEVVIVVQAVAGQLHLLLESVDIEDQAPANLTYEQALDRVRQGPGPTDSQPHDRRRFAPH